MSALSQMLKSPGSIEGMTALGPDKFVLRIDFTHNAIGVELQLTRLQVERARALLSEALSSTQDSVTDPAQLARVIPHKAA